MSEGSSEDLPERPVSLWMDTAIQMDLPPLEGDTSVDVAIVGGGIVGLLCAHELKDRGFEIVIVDSRRILSGVTGHTTAKLTALHGSIYHRLESTVGIGGARVYAEANQAGIEGIASLSEDYGIDCDLKRVPAYTYAVTEDQAGNLKKDAQILEDIGMKADFMAELNLPFETKGAVMLEDQGRFHPRKFLLAIAERLMKDGVLIYEGTKAIDVGHKKGKLTLETERGNVKADHLIVATNFPFTDPAFYFARMNPKRSYVLAARHQKEVPDGLFYNADKPFFSFRKQEYKDGEVLLIGGQNHKTGHGGSTKKRYSDLRTQAKDSFDIGKVEYMWSTQDYVTQDLIPYIGKIAPLTKDVYLAAGFGGWGMAHGMVSAMILRDAILDKDNEWSFLYNPLRIKVSEDFKMVRENVKNAETFIKDWIEKKPDIDLASLDRGLGKVAYVNGDRTAVYKDDDGSVYYSSPVCTHMGCMVEWNDAERTWDCPCHGSRFYATGEVMRTPAVKDLKKKDPSLRD